MYWRTLELLNFREHPSSPPVFLWSHIHDIVHLFSFMYCVVFFVDCLLRVSCVYGCVCWFSLIFILSSSCVLCLLLCVGSLWYLFCPLHVLCLLLCVGSLWYLCCILHVSCVYCCVCRFSLIFIYRQWTDLDPFNIHNLPPDL